MSDCTAARCGKLLIYLVSPWDPSTRNGDFGPPVSDCLGMGYVAAVLRAGGYSVAIFDGYVTPLGPEQLAERIGDDAADRHLVLGFSFMGAEQVECATLLVESLRRRGTSLLHVLAGGQFASGNWHALLANPTSPFDSVVCGEAEDIIGPMMDRLERRRSIDDVPGVASRQSGMPRLQRRRENPDLRTLPWPSRDSLETVLARGGVVNIDTSRGCESNCTFCMSREVLKHTPSRDRWRSRTPRDVAEEIQWLARERGATRFNFTDENTMGNRSHRRRLLELADEIAGRGLRIQFNVYFRAQDVDFDILQRLHEVGLGFVFIGIESFWQPTLDRFNKGIDEATNIRALRAVRQVDGLRLYFGLMMFHPWVTLEELRHNLRRIRQEILGIRLTGPELLRRLLQVLILYKGTPVHHRAKKDGLVEHEPAFDQWECPYSLAEAPRSVLRFVRSTLVELLEVHNDVYLAGIADGHRRDAALQAVVQDLIARMESHVLDATEAFADALAEGASASQLCILTDAARHRTRELIASVKAVDLPRPRGVRNVDQPDETFLREAARVAGDTGQVYS